MLHEPVDLSVDKALADRGVTSSRGDVLLAIDGRDGVVATEVIAELGLDFQVVHNRCSAMILPAAVTKGTGLAAALDVLGPSAHNALAVGDAENDLSLLRAAEVGAAVADAVPSLLDHADLVLGSANGTGVVGLLGGALLRGHQRLCPPRRWVPIGWFDDGSPAMLPGSQSSVLVTGDTGLGKSYLAGLQASGRQDQFRHAATIVRTRPPDDLVDSHCLPQLSELPGSVGGVANGLACRPGTGPAWVSSGDSR